MALSVLETLSNELSAATDAVGGSVIAIYGRRWMPSSGIQWRKGVIVTAHHTVRREEDITVVVDGGKSVKANLAGRDPSTDLAIPRWLCRRLATRRSSWGISCWRWDVRDQRRWWRAPESSAG
jgi:S1-C subfamily serine protease